MITKEELDAWKRIIDKNMSIKEKYDINGTLNYLIKDNYAVLRELLKTNGSVSGSVRERMMADNGGRKFVDEHGYDDIKDDKKWESKQTQSIINGMLQINTMLTKKGKCDMFTILDAVNYRMFEIPADVFFKRAKIYKNNKGTFCWSASYNEKDRIMVNNTQLLLEYETVESKNN
jgi:hypothetical protein